MPFPLFLVLVCAAVTLGATSIRALGSGSGMPGMGDAMAGTAGRLMAFLDYFAGVFTLLSLTAAVVCGLAATDRLVLTVRQRIAVQSVHRATSVAALGFLATHIAVKLAERDATPLTALLPFGGGATLAVSLGTVAADLLVLTAVTGAVRGRFAGSGRPWLWRLLHSGAYACWPIALAHGLTAGRQAAVWVLWSYGLCVAAVALALLVRLLGATGRGSAGRRGRRALRAYTPAPSRGARGADSRSGWAEEALSPATHVTLSVYADAETTAVPVAEYAAPPGQDGPHGQGGLGGHDAHPYRPVYGYPVPWPGDDQARPHPWPAETPPHGFALPQDLLATPYPPSPHPAGTPDWLDDSGAWPEWGALTWDTPPHGVPVGPVGHEHGGQW